jgi:hypothetical protein
MDITTTTTHGIRGWPMSDCEWLNIRYKSSRHHDVSKVEWHRISNPFS